jgi:hypothetical protein
MTRFIALLLAAVAAAAAFLHPVFRASDGALAGSFVVPAAVSIAFFACALWGGARERRRAIAWFAIGIVGQAAALQLVHAGPSIGYQHYVTSGALFSPAVLPWTLIVLAQTGIVAVAVATHARRASRALVSRLPGWRWIVLLLAFVLTSTSLMRDLAHYGFELVLASMLQLSALASFAFGAIALPDPDVIALHRRSGAWFGSGDPDEEAGCDAAGFWRLDRFVLGVALFVLVATSLLAILSYQRHPHVPDEVVYLVQAKYFAHGMIQMPLPPVRPAFDLDLMTYDATRWYSPVPPGWPAVLALGVMAGVPWLVNPVLSALSIILAYVLVRGITGQRTARASILLLAASPWFLFLGMSFMTHQFTLAVALGGAACAAYLRRDARTVWAIPAGIALGLLALIRPLEGFIAALLLAIWVLGNGPFGRRALQVAIMAIASIVTASMTLPYNRHFTGSATTFPIMAYTDSRYGAGSNALGFGANRGLPFGGLDPFPGHGLRDIIVNTDFNLFQVNIELLGWATGSILLIALLLLSSRLRRVDAWMLAVVLAVVGAHAFYWFSGGPDFGARYWYLILLPCIVLTVRSLDVVAEWTGDPVHAARPWIGAFALSLSALFVFVPWRAADKYHDYRSMQPGVRELEKTTRFGRSLILVRGNRHPDYASAAIYNPVDLRADAPIFAWDRDAGVRLQVLEAYRDRDVWIVDGPTLTGDGYRIEAGPIPAERMISEMAR